MLIPSDYGGGSVTAQPLVDLIVLGEELGRALNPGPFVPCNVVAGAIARYGTSAQASEYLPQLAGGRAATAAWCLSSDGSPNPDWSRCGRHRRVTGGGGSTACRGTCRPPGTPRCSSLSPADPTVRSVRSSFHARVPAFRNGPVRARRDAALRRGPFGRCDRPGRQFAVRRPRRGGLLHLPRHGPPVSGVRGRGGGRLRIHRGLPEEACAVRPDHRQFSGDQAPAGRPAPPARGDRPAAHYAALAFGDGLDKRARRLLPPGRTSTTRSPASVVRRSSCTAASASPGSTTSTSSPAGPRRTRCSTATGRGTASGWCGSSRLPWQPEPRWRCERMDVIVAPIPDDYDDYRAALRAFIAAHRPTLTWKQRTGVRLPDRADDVVLLRRYVRDLDEAGNQMDRFPCRPAERSARTAHTGAGARPAGVPYVLGNPLVAGRSSTSAPRTARHLPPRHSARRTHLDPALQ